MLVKIFLILSILVMLVMLINVIYNLITTIKNDRDLEKYKKKQWETLNKIIEREEIK